MDPVLATGQQRLIVCTEYAGVVPAALVGFKDRGVRRLGAELANVLAAGLIAATDRGGQGAHVVPAASSPSAVRRRGFDHMAQLARHAAAMAGLPWRQLLVAGRRADQTGLDSAARRRNVSGRMRSRPPGSGGVIVVDDIRASGATLAECDRALQAGGYTVLAHVVIAAVI